MHPFLKYFLPLCATLVTGACAQNHHKDAAIERLNLGTWEQDIGYTQTLIRGDRLYISGLVSEAGSFNEQLNEIYSSVQKILAQQHLDSSQILKETIYTTDINALQAAIPIRKGFYANNLYPSASWVQVQRLYTAKNLVEVELEVWRPTPPNAR